MAQTEFKLAQTPWSNGAQPMAAIEHVLTDVLAHTGHPSHLPTQISEPDMLLKTFATSIPVMLVR